MNKRNTNLSLALATALGASTALADNPFSMQELPGGYMLADASSKTADGKCGEGKCGESGSAPAKAEDGKCGEGKCGETEAAPAKAADGNCGAKSAEGSCGSDKK